MDKNWVPICNRAEAGKNVFSSEKQLCLYIPSLQLGTVTLAGRRLSVACQCECRCPSVRPSAQRMRGASCAINRSAQRTQRGPAVSWAPRVGAHEYKKISKVDRDAKP